MSAVSTSVMIGAIVTYLRNKLVKEESVNSFFDDFSEATVNWIKPLFIKEDDTPTRSLEKFKENPNSEARQNLWKATLESELEDDSKVEKYIKEIFEKISQLEEGATIINNISNSKNVVTGNISTQGDVNIGDTINKTINKNGNHSDVKGNQNIVIQGVNDANISIVKDKIMR